MDASEQEFRTWLKKNRALFAGRTPDEVALMARLVGFEAELTCRVLSHFQDALRGSSIDNRVSNVMECEMWAIDRRSGKIDLEPQWHELADYLMRGEEFRSL